MYIDGLLSTAVDCKALAEDEGIEKCWLRRFLSRTIIKWFIELGVEPMHMIIFSKYDR